MRFVMADCERIAVENPVGFMNSAYRKADQTIHPYMFAEPGSADYVTKGTCLWLKGLPPLVPKNTIKPNNKELFGVLPSGKARTWEDSVSRSGKVRSKTFPGIAEAMAEQWGGLETTASQEKRKKPLIVTGKEHGKQELFGQLDMFGGI